MALESDGDATYNPSTGVISSSGYTGNTLIANTSLDIAGSSGLILENDETITNSTDGTVLITSPTTSLSGDLLVGTSVQAATIDYTDGDVALTIADGGAVTTSGNLTVGDNLSLGSDASVITLGDDSEVSITHVPDAGILIGGGNEIQFRDNGLKISSTTDGQLDIGPWEQIFYGEFDGRRRKRVQVKNIGD